MTAPIHTLDTTETSLHVLELVKEREGVRLFEVAETLGCATSTAHTHLRTLESNGYLTREGDEYHVGYKFVNFGEYARYRKQCHRLAEQAVHRVSEQTNEESDYGVEDHGRHITIHESYYDSQVNQRRGGSYHYMHTTATGKAILAGYPDYRVREIVDQWGLEELTPRTITSQSALDEELKRIRQDGYAINDEEFMDGLRAIAVSVEDDSGEALGAISVSGPSYRLTIDNIVEDIYPVLRRAVDDLEAQLQT